MLTRKNLGPFLAGAAASGVLCASLLLPGSGARAAGGAAAQRGPNFPRMNSALAALEQTRQHLIASENAYPGDHFNGHRQAALESVNNAIRQVRYGTEFGQ